MDSPDNTKELVERFSARVKDVFEFDKDRIHSVVQTILSPNAHENCVLGNYYRAFGNVQTLVSLGGPQDFQVVAMIARNLFETSVELALIHTEKDAAERISCFSDVEKLRIARRLVRFKEEYPEATVDVSIYQNYVHSQSDAIEAGQKRLWPVALKVEHWSGISSLADRADKLGDPFHEWYNVYYPQMSFYVHSGLVGVHELPTIAFLRLSGIALNLAGEAYCKILQSVIKEFRIAVTDDKIESILTFARMVSFTKNDEEAKQLLHELLS